MAQNSSLTTSKGRPNLGEMQKQAASAGEESDSTFLWRASLPRSYLDFFGQKLVRFLVAVHGLGAFALITLGAMFSKSGAPRNVMPPLILTHPARSALLP